MTLQNLEHHMKHQYFKHSSNFSVDQRINVFLTTLTLDLQTCDLHISHTKHLTFAWSCCVQKAYEEERKVLLTGNRQEWEQHVKQRSTTEVLAAQESRGVPLYFLQVSLSLSLALFLSLCMLLYECFYTAVSGPLIQHLKSFKKFSLGAE